MTPQEAQVKKSNDGDTISRQAEHIADSDKMIKLKKRTITERLIIANSLIASVIADSDNDQFRDTTKKTEEESISKQEVLTNMRTLCDGCYLMEHCGQCNPNCLLRKAMDVVEKIKTDSERVSLPQPEKSNSFSEEPSEEGNSEMNCSDEWWKNYIRSRMSNDDVPDIRVGKTDFKPETVTNCHGLMDDLISRQAAIDALMDEFKRAPTTAIRAKNRIERLPFVQPESTRTFVELVVKYPDPEFCAYKEYKGKPYYSIKYIENGETYVGYGTYDLKVMSQYLKEYFISSAQPDGEYISQQAVTESDLIDWYINSVDESEPVWTEEHIYELFNDFYLIPKENR